MLCRAVAGSATAVLHLQSPKLHAMRSKRGNSSSSVDRMGVRGSSYNSIDRLGLSSTDRLSRLVRSRRGQVLLLFVLVVGGLLLSSMTLFMHQSTSSMDASGPDSPAGGRLHTLGGPAAADSAANQVSDRNGGGVSDQQGHEQRTPSDKAATAAVDSLHEPKPDRRPWRWKDSQAAAGQQQARAAAPSGQAGLLMPTNLLAQLAKQPPAEVTAAAPYKIPASQAAAALAQPEDLSLILAAEGTEEQRGQQQQQKSLTSVRPAGLQADVDPADGTSVYIKQRGVEPTRLKHPLWWHGPMWSGSGYGSEAVNFVLSLLRTGRLAPADIWSYHHGDAWREHIVKSMSTEDRTDLEYLQSLPVRYRHKRSAVVVCHSVATNWAFPEPMWTTGAPCPPNPKEFAWVYSVGRTMFETDRLHAVFVPRLNAMNEIWVPSEWQRRSFIQSGVDASKLVVVPEGVNTSLYDPALYTPLALRDKAQLVFGRHWEVKLGQQATAVLGAANGSAADLPTDPQAAAAAAGDASDAGDSVGSKGALASGLIISGGGDGTDSARRRTVLQQPRERKADQPPPGSKLYAVPQTGNGNRPAKAAQQTASSSSSSSSSGSSTDGVRRPFRFISTFKWEERKGWSILLEAYLTAFTAEDDVELYILTQPFAQSGSSFKEKMRGWAGKLNITHANSTSSSAAGRSLLSVHRSQQQQEQQQDEAASDSMGVPFDSESEDRKHAAAASPAAWAAHVGSVVQQIEEFAGQLQHKRRRLQGTPSAHAADTPPPPAAAAAAADESDTAAAQRQLQQASSAKAAGITIETQPQLANPAAFTKTAAAGTTTPEPLLTAAARARARLQQRAAYQAVRNAFETEAAAVQYPTLYVVDSHISDADFPRFYKAADAFVLPSRGEGWGRPHVEAMSMGLPVISTNWSGITAYLDETVGYPIAIDGLVPVNGGDEVIWWFKGLKWAQPSVAHLTQLMRRVYSNRQEAAARGAAGRARMVERYSPEAIADVVVKELQRIQDKVP